MSNVAPTIEQFKERFPQLATSPLGETQLALSVKLLDPATWEEFYAEGVLLDCAHNLELLKLGAAPGGATKGAAGPIASASGAGLSASFNSISPDGKNGTKDWYNKTVYGQMFLRLKEAVTPIGFLA